MPFSRTLEENLRLLRKTDIPTVLVEGRDDVFILHWIFGKIGLEESRHNCGDRTMLFQIYDVVQKDPKSYPNVRLFLADQDMFVFTGIAQEYAGITFTYGYSLENDLFAGNETYIDNLLVHQTLVDDKNRILNSVIKWYAFEVEDYLEERKNGREKETLFSKVKIRNKKIFSTTSLDFEPSFLESRGFYKPKKDFIENITDNYALKLRGHTLFEIILLVFQLRREMKIKMTRVEKGLNIESEFEEPHYKDSQLLNICFASATNNPDSLISQLIDKIIASLK